MDDSQGASDLEHAIQELITPVRLGDGLDALAVDRALAAVRVTAAQWRARGCVSLADAALLVASYPDLEAASYLYGDSDAERIREVARQLNEECLRSLL
jgi:hypothetical protein